MRPGGTVRKRLVDLGAEVARERETLRILDEQVAYQREVADDLGTRAVVAGTPLADRERRDAQEDLRRLERAYGEAKDRVRELLEEQDRLLERLGQDGA